MNRMTAIVMTTLIILVVMGITTFIPVLKQLQANAASLRQNSNQEALCFRSNTCRDSNVDQGILGNDNQMTGFAGQSDNTTTNHTSTASSGSQGLSGAKGDPGPQGPKGDTGATGQAGKQGITFHSFINGQDGWTPNGLTFFFNMSGSDLNDISESSVIIINVDSGSDVNTAATICNVIHKFDNGFHIYCSGAANLPPSTARLDIAVLNPN